MQHIGKLGLHAKQWQFLLQPDKYVNASKGLDRKLVRASTRRQFLTARDILVRLNGSHREKARRGVMLADDVGLGKTTVAALVAWVVASAGERRGVRILAPNEVMARRWEEELRAHVVLLQKCARALDVRSDRIKARKLARLSAGSIQIVKHSYASSNDNLACDLLIVDEAHRAKGKNTEFSQALNRQRKHAQRVLILTATPFSLRLEEELIRMLTFIGGEEARYPVRSFSRALADLYSGDTARSHEVVAQRLAKKAKAAVDALSPYVIRHGIDDLPNEIEDFGCNKDWSMEVPEAKPNELDLMMHMDRALRVAKKYDVERFGATNDPRFHVGWQHFDIEMKNLKKDSSNLAKPAKSVIKKHLAMMRQLRREVGVHSKMAAVVKAVKEKVEDGEKVVLFCHHLATAQELTACLGAELPKVTAPRMPRIEIWRKAWMKVLPEWQQNDLCDVFISWLCSDLNRGQTWKWIGSSATSADSLAKALKRKKSRYCKRGESIAEAAERLYHTLLQSKSSRGVLKVGSEHLPGGKGGSQVLGVCEASGDEEERLLFIRNLQPDTVISVFNSPFGPNVLVVTDKLSEGIDLHRYCRHLVHYELDPSPVRTVQRNGRLRRVNSWAAITRQPIRYAYPAFRGTRDHNLVKIMKKRIDSFSLLLGGVQSFDVDDVVESAEAWRNKVISTAKDHLQKVGGQLRAKK